MLKKLWNDPVWSKVIAGIILAIGAFIGTYLLNWWPAIGRFATGIYDFAFTSTLLPNWLIGALGLFASLTIFVILVIVWKSIFPSPSNVIDWRNYTTDLFFGLRWRWRYLEEGQPYEVHTFCPHCDFQVYAINTSAYAVDRIAFKCDSCGLTLGEFNDSIELIENKVKRFIQQKLRNGSWATARNRP